MNSSTVSYISERKGIHTRKSVLITTKVAVSDTHEEHHDVFDYGVVSAALEAKGMYVHMYSFISSVCSYSMKLGKFLKHV